MTIPPRATLPGFYWLKAAGQWTIAERTAAGAWRTLVDAEPISDDEIAEAIRIHPPE